MDKEAESFDQAFGRVERALTHNGLIQKNKKVAMADWKALAGKLGDTFFEMIRDSGRAKNLINLPPKSLDNQNQQAEWSAQPSALQNVEALIIQGVCKVRANFLHHEKFAGSEEDIARDRVLLSEGRYVLEQAEENCVWLRSAIQNLTVSP